MVLCEDPTDRYVLIGVDAAYCFGQGLMLSFLLDNRLNEGCSDHHSSVENRDAPKPGNIIKVMVSGSFDCLNRRGAETRSKL